MSTFMKAVTVAVNIAFDVKKPLPLCPSFSPGARCSMYDGDKVYLGVRVKMPVRDLLRNIRLAKGCEPQDFQVMGLECA